MQLHQLQRRQGETLTKGCCCRLNRLGRELLLGFQLTGNSPRQIRIRTSVDAQSMHPGPIQVIVQLAHRLDHADIARHLKNLGEINQAIGFLVVVVNRPATNGELTDVVNAAVGLNRLLL